MYSMYADVAAEPLSAYLSDLVEGALQALQTAGCVRLARPEEGGGDGEVESTTTGRIASFYYLRCLCMYGGRQHLYWGGWVEGKGAECSEVDWDGSGAAMLARVAEGSPG